MNRFYLNRRLKGARDGVIVRSPFYSFLGHQANREANVSRIGTVPFAENNIDAEVRR